VRIEPTSLIDEATEGASRYEGGSARSVERGDIGKLSVSSLRRTLLEPVGQNLSTVTEGDGAWAFPPVTAPAYYLLTFSKPGYQTKRFVVNAVDGATPDPMKVELQPGKGRLSGTIAGPEGGVGSASITITDGTNTLTTSSNSTDAPGTWAIDGLSTPGTYLVSVHKEGLGSESALVSLEAAGSATVDLVLQPGVAAITGTISGYDSLGGFGGLGNVTVTATSGDLVRTTSTVTGTNLRGSFVLPQLPTPGAYTLTIAADGYQSQTQQVEIGAGQSAPPISVTLTGDSATIQGSVLVQLAPGGEAAPAAGIAITLSDAEGVAYKTLTNNDGVYILNGVAPGSYTVAASRFRNETSFATIEARSGVPSTIPSFVLPYRDEAPATSRLERGRVVDARSGGRLCDRELFRDQVCEDTYTVTVTGNDLPQPLTDQRPTTDSYTIPREGDPSGITGLQPGSYTITVTAGGYESASVEVQVPLGAVITPPPIALYPTATLRGLVLPAVGEPNAPTCVTATRLDGLGTPVPTCTVGASETGEPQAECSATRSSGNPDAPPPVIACSLVSTVEPPPDGDVPRNGYRIPNLSAGSYYVQVFTFDPEYVPPAAATVVVALGEVRNYDTTINRLGRATVTVLVPDRSTGSLTAAGGATVTIGNGDPAQDRSAVTPAQDGPGARKGVVGFVGMQPGAYGLTASSPEGEGSLGGISVGFNQDLQLTMSITRASPGFAGKVAIAATVVQDGVTVVNPGAAGATVTVSGIVGYTNSVPTTASVDVTADADGCFAIVPSQSAEPPASGACPSVAPENRAVLGLLTDTASIAVEETGQSQAVAQQTHSVAAGSVSITAQPKGVPVTEGRLLVSRGAPADWPLRNASIQVLTAAPGAAGVTVTSDANGVLTWNDPNFATGSARPGVYKLRASLAGFDDSQVVTVNVPLSGTPTFTDDDRNPASMVLTPYSSIAVSVVDTAGNPLPNADVVLSGSTIGSVRKSPSSGGNTVTFDGLSTVPAYTATIRVAGYAFTDLSAQTATCTTFNGSTQVGGPYVLTSSTLRAPANGSVAACTIALTPLGSIAGALRGQLLTGDPTLTDLSGVVVVARKCDEPVGPDSGYTADCTLTTGAGAQSFQAVTAADGSFRITGSTTDPGLAGGYWQVTATANGYEPYVQGVPVQQQAAPTCATAPDPAGCVIVVDSLKVDVTFTLADAADVPIVDAVVTLRRLDGSIVGVVDKSAAPGEGQPARTNSYTFNDVDPTTYSLSVTAPGKAPLNVNTITLPLGQTAQTYPLVLGSTANGVSGGVYGQKPGQPAVPLVAHVTINASPTDLAPANGTDGRPMEAFTTVSSPANPATDGTYHILNVPNGTWYVHVVSDQYGTQVQSKSLTGGAQELANFVLTAVNHPVAVTLQSVNGFDLTGARATLSTANDCTAGSADADALALDLVRSGTGSNTYAGAFQSQLPGTYYVRVAVPAGHLPPAMPCQSVTVSGASGSAPPAPVAFQVTERMLLFRVIADPTTGAPANVPVSVSGGGGVTFTPAIPADGAAVGTTYRAYVAGASYEVTATPDADEFPGWSPMTRTIVTYANPAPATAGAAETLTVTQRATVTVTVTRDGAAIASGDPQPTVTLRRGTTVVDTETTTAGVATFSGLEPGIAYTATASITDGGTYQSPASAAVTPGPGINSPVTVDVVTVGTAVITVVNGLAEGATNGDARVTLLASCAANAATVVPTTAANADGVVTLQGLRRGTYGATAEYRGFTSECETITISVGVPTNLTLQTVNDGDLIVTVNVQAAPAPVSAGSSATVTLVDSCTTMTSLASQPTVDGRATFTDLVASSYGFVANIGQTRASPCGNAVVTARGVAEPPPVIVPEA
jgi:hypothetical protein